MAENSTQEATLNTTSFLASWVRRHWVCLTQSPSGAQQDGAPVAHYSHLLINALWIGHLSFPISFFHSPPNASLNFLPIKLLVCKFLSHYLLLGNPEVKIWIWKDFYIFRFWNRYQCYSRSTLSSFSDTRCLENESSLLRVSRLVSLVNINSWQMGPCSY